MSLDFQSTPLWQRTLADQGGADPSSEAREQLRASYLQLRKAVEPLAGEIALSMPSFTVHSIEHCDALWQIGSLLMPDGFDLNPAEAYVLGGTFLLHDLGMGLSAFERGEAEIREDPLFGDLVAHAESAHQLRSGSKPNHAEQSELEAGALVSVLRRRHAREAERLVSRSFKTSFADSYYLIEKTDLRHAWGPLIGRIAHSHWFDVSALEEQFGQVRGSLAGYPPEWEVDPLKIACALRLSDACHVDADRAPTYLSAVRPVEGLSAQHWYFQERLNQPRLERDRLIYTANVAFDAGHAQEWWLAYETATFIDGELRRVDSLCQESGRPRFAARSVAGAESSERFSKYVAVDGWIPTDAKLTVSSVNDLASSLGGQNLYGNNPFVAIRELVANAADATRARVTQFKVASDASIYVSLRKEGDAWWLEIEDRGIGMSSSRLLSSLTDFGHSGWMSPDVLEDYPGLVAGGFRSIGRFGVGFYSAFMISDYVEVRTLKYRDASRATTVLVFPRGLSGRPLLRPAFEREELHVGGTVVKLRLRHDPVSREGIFQTDQLDESVGVMLRTALASTCALVEYDIFATAQDDLERTLVVPGGEWKVATPGELFALAYAEELRPTNGTATSWVQLLATFSDSASDILNDSGDVIGRASLSIAGEFETMPWWSTAYAKVYVGGLFAGRIYGMLGVFVGEPLRADRLRGFPTASQDQLREWAAQQASDLTTSNALDPRVRNATSVARGLGARLEEFPIAISSSGALLPSDLENWLRARDRVLLIPEWEIAQFASEERLKLAARDSGEEIVLSDDSLLMNVAEDWIFPDEIRKYPKDERFSNYGDLTADKFNARYWWYQLGAIGSLGMVLEALTSAWSMSASEIADASLYHELLNFHDTRVALGTREGGTALVDGLEIIRTNAR